MEFSREEYWSELPFPSSGHLPKPEIELGSPVLQADSLLAEPPYLLTVQLFSSVTQSCLTLQAGFRKGRGTRDQIATFRWIIKKAREFQKNIYFCFIDYAKAFDHVDHNKLWKIPMDYKTPGLPVHH